jgi:methionine-S-sulfoxide reductase
MNDLNKTAVFAGGCFWCTEHDLRAVPGVIDAVSGYSGGDTVDPDYYNHGDHRESVQITYDSSVVTFKKLCQFFLDHIDPTDPGGQFYDRGTSYKTAIFYKNEEEKLVAENLIKELDESGLYAPLKIAVEVLPEKDFYRAEEYHQNYADKNIMHYTGYAKGSGRVQFVANTCAVRDQKHIQWKD